MDRTVVDLLRQNKQMPVRIFLCCLFLKRSEIESSHCLGSCYPSDIDNATEREIIWVPGSLVLTAGPPRSNFPWDAVRRGQRQTHRGSETRTMQEPSLPAHFRTGRQEDVGLFLSLAAVSAAKCGNRGDGVMTVQCHGGGRLCGVLQFDSKDDKIIASAGPVSPPKSIGAGTRLCCCCCLRPSRFFSAM